MAVEIQPVSGGLVQTKDPSVLADGELSRAENCHYKPNDGGLTKNGGRTKYNATPEAGTIIGSRFLEFDKAVADLFVIRVDTALRVGDAGQTGTFSDLETGLAAGATGLEAVHYANKWYLLDGVERNRVVSPGGTDAFHGMLANVDPPTLAPEAGTAGSGFILSSGKKIVYWVEERVKDGDLIVRRNASTTNETVTMTGDGLTKKPVITLPTVVNSDATHWALYATATDGGFPVGAEIAEALIASTSIEDTRSDDDPGIPTGPIYETYSVVTAAGPNITSRNGPPPIATTGATLEDSLVLNDIDEPRGIRYSFPDAPEKFPALNFILFETGRQDEVILIRRVGNALGVVLRDSLWRVNLLPRPQDAFFDVQRAKEEVVGAFGCVSAMAGVVIATPFGPRLLYISPYGVVISDLSAWDVATDDIDWNAAVDVTKLNESVLVDNPREYRAEFYFTATGGALNARCFYLHYHPSHLKQGEPGTVRLKVTGPHAVLGTTAMLANISGDRRIFTGDGSTLFLEDNGSDDESEAGGGGNIIDMVVKSKDMYTGGLGGQARATKAYCHHSAAPGQTATMTVLQRSEGKAEEDVDNIIALDRRELTQGPLQGFGDNISLQFRNDDDVGPVRLDFFAIDVDRLGESTSG